MVFVVGIEMPLVSRLMSGDLELLAALDDMPQEAMAESQAFGIDFVSQLIDQAATPHRHTEQELKDRAQTLIGLAHLGGLVANEKIRRGLSVERFATILADLIVDGIGPVGEER